MKWWVFSEEQLEKALESWFPQSGPQSDEARHIREFLMSQTAREHGLRGDNEP